MDVRLRPKAVHAYYGWIKGHVAENTPWDEVVRQVITATGETGDNGATNFYLATSVARRDDGERLPSVSKSLDWLRQVSQPSARKVDQRSILRNG